MIGIIAPSVWLLMTFATGMLGAGVRQLAWLTLGRGLGNPVSLLAAVAAIFSVLMIVACTRRWMKEYSGLGKSLSTFLVSLAIVLVYYGILVVWFWKMIPSPSAQN